MGKARQARRLAARVALDGPEATSEIDTISAVACSRSATKTDDNISTDDEILADALQKVVLGDSAQPKKDGKATPPAVPRSLPSPLATPPMAAARAIPLLICSVGNPGSTYANTLHSAGHTVLKKLSERLDFQPYQKSRPHGSGLMTGDGAWTLWQSTSLMNVSGKGVKAAHNTWSQDKTAEFEGKLVIVHDELEKPLGAVNLNVRQGASAKGHNGLKSIMSSIGNVPFVRIGIGIGRPVSRESKDVANYVMRKMTPGEKAKIEGSVEEVIAKLKELESG